MSKENKLVEKGWANVAPYKSKAKIYRYNDGRLDIYNTKEQAEASRMYKEKTIRVIIIED